MDLLFELQSQAERLKVASDNRVDVTIMEDRNEYIVGTLTFHSVGTALAHVLDCIDFFEKLEEIAPSQTKV